MSKWKELDGKPLTKQQYYKYFALVTWRKQVIFFLFFLYCFGFEQFFPFHKIGLTQFFLMPFAPGFFFLLAAIAMIVALIIDMIIRIGTQQKITFKNDMAKISWCSEIISISFSWIVAMMFVRGLNSDTNQGLTLFQGLFSIMLSVCLCLLITLAFAYFAFKLTPIKNLGLFLLFCLLLFFTVYFFTNFSTYYTWSYIGFTLFYTLIFIFFPFFKGNFFSTYSARLLSGRLFLIMFIFYLDLFMYIFA